MNKWQLLAKQCAEQSFGRFRVGAVIVDRKKLISKASNLYKTHPIAARYDIYPYLHAEANAIIKAGLKALQGTTIYVARVDRLNNLCLAKPCKELCEPMIRDVGIVQVVYSISNKEWGVMSF